MQPSARRCTIHRFALTVAIATLTLSSVSSSLTAQRSPSNTTTLIIGAGRWSESLSTHIAAEPPRGWSGAGWAWNAELGLSTTTGLRYEQTRMSMVPAGPDTTSERGTWTTRALWWRVYDPPRFAGVSPFAETGFAWRTLTLSNALTPSSGVPGGRLTGDGWTWGIGATKILNGASAISAGYQDIREGKVVDHTGPAESSLTAHSTRWWFGGRVRIWPLH